MGAVHVGIGHDDHLVVAQLALVKLLPQAGPQGGDHRGELVVAVHLVRPGLLHVEHLAPQGEDGLVPGVPALLGGAAGGVALDDVNFRQGRVPLIAVGQLAREGGPLQGVLPADVLPGAAGGLPGPVGHHGLLQNGPAHGGVLLQIGLQLVGDHVVHQRADLAVAQLGLGLALELGLGEFYRDDAGEALPAVVAGHLVVVFQQAGLLAVGVEHIGEGPLEALLVHAALGGVDVVGKGDDDLAVAVVVLHGHLGHGVLLGARHVDHVLVDGGLVLVDEGDKFPDAPLIAHVVLFLLTRAQVHRLDAQPGVEEGLLPHAGVEGVVVVFQGVKHLRIGLEGDRGPRVVGPAHHLHLLGDLAPGELHLVNFPVLVDLDLQPLAQGVDHRRAHAVEAAGHLIAAAAEFSSRVQDGENYLQGGPPGLGLDVYWDAAAVVGDGDGVAGIDGDGDVGAVARQGLVDGVVHDLIHQVVQARFAGGADVHAGALAHRLQPLQHLDLRAAVFVFHLGGIQF